MNKKQIRFTWHLAFLSLLFLGLASLSLFIFRNKPFQAKADLPPYTTTVTNFDPNNRAVIRFDVDGNAVDAHDGDLVYFDDKYYLYGTSYDCGYKLQVNGTPFCGFKAYSSTDLVYWKDEGFLFDATTPEWQGRCAAPKFGCYRPHVLFNSTTNKYILWINSYDNASNYHVFTADTPQGPFVEAAEPDMATEGAAGALTNGDMDLFQDDDGTAYIAYTNISSTPTHTIKIQKLNAEYTSGTGTAISAVATGGSEAPSLFRKSNTYYLVYGPTCSYCGGTSTQYKSATSPMGTWGAATQLNANSCGGQPSFVAKIPGVSEDLYVYGSDLWNNGNPNEALANFYWAPLTFSGTNINSFSCQASVSVKMGEGSSGQPNNSDQSSGMSFFRPHCDINTWSRMQTFVAGKSGKLTSVSFTSYQSGNPNAGLILELFNLDANGAPIGSSLASTTIPVSSVGWSPRNMTLSPNISVYGGTQYGIRARTTNSNAGACYGFLYNDYKPYQAGKAMYLPQGGSWTAESSRSLKFQTAIN
jgi:hypothetical protein